MKRRLVDYVFLAFSLLLLTGLALAQTETARIQGAVTDANGAGIAGATVTARDMGTGREIKAVTGDDGSYSVLSLKPGKYQIEASQTNFKTLKREITLEVAQTAQLNLALEAGAVSETVTVSNDIPQVDTATSAIGNVVQGRAITELPLNGRNVLELARLSPGVTQGVINGDASGTNGNAETYRGRNTGGAALAVNGQRPQANNFLLDGVDNNESLVNTINIFPSADAVQEFRVQTSVATAEFGRGGGAIINSVTRSGERQYHGSAYLFIRNSALDVRPAFFDSVQADRRTPLFRRGQFGGTVGGPAVPLGSLREKVFVFFSYEGVRQLLPISTDIATVPTAAFRTGDFSQLLNPALSGLGAPIQLRDPMTGLDIPGNRIDQLPGNRMNTAALNYLRAFPMPNNGSQVQRNFTNTRVEDDSQDVFDFRVDGNVNENNQVFVRGNWGGYDQTVTSRLPTLPSGFGSGTNPTRTKGLVVGWNWSIKPTLFNELRLQGNKIKYGYEPPFGDIPLSADLGIVNANRDESLGGGALIGGFNNQLEYTGDFGPYRVPQETLQGVDSITWVKGDHTFKFGGSILHRNVQLFRPLAGKGDFRMYGDGNFNNCPNANNPPGVPENASGTTRWEQADLLIGFMCTYDIGFQQGNVGTTNWENAIFGQDDWRVNHRLTLNLGLRYELFTNPAEQYARQANFDLATGHLVLAQGSSDTLTNTDHNNFSPRLGFAYDLKGNGKSVIRGGYGIFYFLDRGGISNQLAQNPPFAGSARITYNQGFRVTFTGQGPMNNNDSRLATQPLPLPAPNTDPAFLNNPTGVNVLAVIPDNKISNVQQFNVQFQYLLFSDTALSVGYVGTRGRNLILYYNLNGTAFSADTAAPCPIAGRTLGQCYPGLNDVIARDDIGESQYDSLQVQLTRRLVKGWQYIAAYTFSKTKDNGEGGFDNTANGKNFIEPFATSRIDYPHVFTFATLWEIPYGRGRTYGSDISRWLDYIIGGWMLNGIFRAQSGSPFDVRDGNGRLVDLTGDPYTHRDDKNPFLERASFSPVASGLGSLERNSLRSPSNAQLNLGLSKDFRITEDIKLQFRMEAFNVFNSIQWAIPDTNINGGAFGTYGSGNVVPFSNRQIQFGGRLQF